MDISVTTNPNRMADYIEAQTDTVKMGKKVDTLATTQTQDKVVISSKAQATQKKWETVATSSVDAVSEERTNGSKATTFTTFAEEFSKLTQRYTNTIREHYAAAHEENLTYDSPSTHIWDKYKNPDSPLNTQESKDRMSAAVRVGAPEIIAEFRAWQQDMSLVINQNRDIDPDGSVALQTYMRAYAQPAVNARKTIEGYYAEAHAENSSYPFLQGLEHIAEKYKRPDSGIFRSDLTEAQRDMAYRQERALLTGARLTLFDPYALASIGGVQTAQASHRSAMQAVMEKMNELKDQLYGIE